MLAANIPPGIGRADPRERQNRGGQRGGSQELRIQFRDGVLLKNSVGFCGDPAAG